MVIFRVLAVALIGFAVACSEDAPAVPLAGSVKIGAIADCQYADKDPNGERLYRSCPEKLVEAIGVLNEFDLDFVVHLGDFIDEGWGGFELLNGLTAGLYHPVRHVVGNHDYYVSDEKKAEVHKALGMPDRYYSFEKGNWVFAVVDGNDFSYHGWPEGSERHRDSVNLHTSKYADKYEWNGAMGEAQLTWLESVLEEAGRRKKRVVVFSHFPIFPQHDLNLWNDDDVIRRFERHLSATAWISGHNHDGAYTERNGVHYITLKAMLDTDRTAFSVIEFGEDNILLSGFGRQDDIEIDLNATPDFSANR